MMDKKTRVLIYEDNHKLRSSLQMLIGGDEEFEVVGSVPGCNHVIHEARKPALIS